MSPALALWLACLASLAVADPGYRLDTPLRPTAYSLRITPYFNTSDERQFSFDGEVSINFLTTAPTSYITLHAQELQFNASDVSVWSGSTVVPLVAENALEFNETYNFAYIRLGVQLEVGAEYFITINYKGLIRTDLTGFYRNYYFENGERKWLGATQMEPTHARKVFPCFDEPQFKASFVLTIDRPANFQPTLTNTYMQTNVSLSNGYVREVFYPTPVMSTYLVAFLVSEFPPAAISFNGSREFGVYARPDAANQTAYTYEIGISVVDALGQYFGIDYYSTNSNLRLDHVALPDFRSGAMENWGLIKYREALLLYVPGESTPYYRYRVAQIVAHETTHMWFGNLVTCHWWGDTWLNEGFANYFQDYITASVDPEVGSSDMLVTASVHPAYQADDTPASAPISNDQVFSPADIGAHFGAISYQKAGSVIRMMHHLLGDQAFRRGLHLYLDANRFGSGYPELLYSALQTGASENNALASYSKDEVEEIMGSWIHQAGHPVVNVDVDYETGVVTLSQKRFFIDPSNATNQTYIVPISYTTAVAPDFQNTKPAFLLENRTQTFTVANLTADTWLIVNLQETGLYRVNYDSRSWEIIASALSGPNRENIHHLNRAKLVNDVFALAYADEVSFATLRRVADCLRLERHYAVWQAGVRGLTRLRNSFLGSDAQTHIESFALDLLEGVISSLGYSERAEDDFVTLNLRMMVLELACQLGHQGCLDHSVQLFRGLVEQGAEIPASLRPVSYCAGLRQGDGADYEFLWARMAATNVANEAREIADALGCSQHQLSLAKYLVSGAGDSPIRTQDAGVPLASVLAYHDNWRLVIDQLQENFTLWDQLYTIDTVLTSVAGVLHSEEDFNEFSSWLTSCSQCSEQSVTSANKAVELARAGKAWADAHRAQVLQALRNAAGSVTPSLLVMLVPLIAAIYTSHK